MEPSPTDDGTARGAVTRVLEAVRQGEPQAPEQLWPLVFTAGHVWTIEIWTAP